MKGLKNLVERLRNELGDPDGDFPAGLIIENNTMTKRYVLNFSYRKKKADGTFTQKKYRQGVIIRYDPFTGEKLD